MEAKAKHEFNATADDELSFEKGEVLKILSKDEDQNWFRAELRGKEGYVPNNYIEMKPHDWFCGKMTRNEAETMLLQRVNGQLIQPDGAFLVRNSESAPGDFSMSVKWYKGKLTRSEAEKILMEKKNGRDYIHPDGAFLVRCCESQHGEFSLSVKCQDMVQHFKILRDGLGKYFLWVVKFESIQELIDFHRNTSVSRSNSLMLKDMKGIGQNNQHFQQHHQQQQLVQEDVRRAKAMYDFQPQDCGELLLKKGDEVTVEDEVDPHWWKGKNCRTNECGLFPASYVKGI